MKIWLDDIRPEPPGWLRCYTAGQVKEVLQMTSKENPVTHLSLDYHLGTAETGDSVLDFLLYQLEQYGILPPEHISAHTSDTMARAQMNRKIEALQKLSETTGNR